MQRVKVVRSSALQNGLTRVATLYIRSALRKERIRLDTTCTASGADYPNEEISPSSTAPGTGESLWSASKDSLRRTLGSAASRRSMRSNGNCANSESSY